MAMTEKKRQFIKAKKMGMNHPEVAVFAGYSEKTAEVQGSRLMRDPDVIKHLGDVKADVKVDEALEVDVITTSQDVGLIVAGGNVAKLNIALMQCRANGMGKVVLCEIHIIASALY